MYSIINSIMQQTNLSEQQAWWLLEFVTERTKTQLRLLHEQITPGQQQKLDDYIEQIAMKHKPLAYILGWVPFLDLELAVKSPTLIPRPETESWVYELITMIKKSHAKNLTILDIGTGSGCIALSLAQGFPDAQIYAIDIAATALELAQKNATLNNISNVIFLQSDLFNNLPAGLTFDLIVSNPPYIDPAVQLDASVDRWEDHGALFAENKGLYIIKQIIQKAHHYLKKNNEIDYQIVMEIDASQGEIVKRLCNNSSFNFVEIRKDQFDRDRTVWIRKN